MATADELKQSFVKAIDQRFSLRNDDIRAMMVNEVMQLHRRCA